jgi:hypothetical protein
LILIKNIKYTLITKQIVYMKTNMWDELLKLN